MEQPSKEEEGEESGVEDHWYLVDAHGQKFRLPKTMLFLGREECDVVVASQSVDKRHAVLTFDIYLNRFKVKDLSTTNGTFVNNQAIKDQEYVTLNHMDSVRLGNDSMMYHIEQGSQITSQGGHLPDHRVIPSWATRRPQNEAPAIHVHTHTMAECQGCIAEQTIEHSCGLHVEKPNIDNAAVNDPNHCMYPGNQPTPPPPNQNLSYNQHQQPPPYNQPLPQCHHCQHHQHLQHHPHLQQQHSYPPSDSHPDHCHPVTSQSPNPIPIEFQQHIQHQLLQQHQYQFQHQHEYTDHHQNTENSFNNSQVGEKQNDSNSGCNNVELENPIENGNNVGPDRNTWPRKRVRQGPHVATLFQQSETADDASCPHGSEAKPTGSAAAMYFVSFDDSVCNGSTSDLNAASVNAHRISRRSPFSKADLITVKKGTPLYGQPDWWGESDAGPGDGGDNGHASHANTDKQQQQQSPHGTANHEGRPSSLVLTPEEPAQDHPVQLARMVSRGSTYMEIPVHGDGDAGDMDSPSDIATTPDGKGPAPIPRSISKDSLFSPDKQPTKSSLTDISPSAEKNPAMSFTIDLSDLTDHPPRKINIGSSLSQFVPPKIRKKKDKAVTTTKGSSAESTPSKTSEERETSPNNQRKIEEIWSSLECKGKPSQLSSVQATAGSSLRSPNLEELEKLSELSDDRRSSEREGEKKGRKPATSKGSPKVSRGAKVGSVKPVATVSLSQYTNATTYLIDKMFEGGGSGSESGVDGDRNRASSSSDKEMSPEQKLYKEAASHDKPKALSSSNKADNGKSSRTSTSKLDSSGNGKRLSSSSNKPETKVASKTKNGVEKSEKVDANEGDEDDLKIVEKDNDADKASEAGTYTIEADEKEAEEEEKARNRIDEVFGVEGDVLNSSSSSSLWRPIIDPALRSMASPGGYDNVRDEDEDEVDGDKTPLDEFGEGLVDSLMIDEDGDQEEVDDDDDDEEEEEEKKKDKGGADKRVEGIRLLMFGIKSRVQQFLDQSGTDPGVMGTEEVQTWVSQLTALTSQKASNNNISDSARQAWDEASDTSSVTKKPPHGLNRKRPGTGRKLPSIPTTDRSPVSSEHSSHVGEQDVSGLEDSMSLPSTELLLHNGKDSATTNGRLSHSPAKSPQVSSQFSKSSPLKTTSATNGHLAGSPSSSVGGGGGKGQQNGSSNVSSPNMSSRSRGSLDTEVLLQDTKTVMAAMEARMANQKQSSNHRADPYQDDSDTDVSSTVALVNGDENYKPTVYRSPRDALSKRTHSASSNNNVSSSSAKKSLGRSYTQATASSKSHSASASPRNVSSTSFTTKKSVVSDVLSKGDSFDNDSIVSDVGSDAGDSTASRSSSKAKGSMSMTKPNRAFQLRRARADSTDEPTTPRTAKSTGKSTVASARSHSTSRVRSSVLDSGRSEASLGAQIARKSRTNERVEKARNSSGSHASTSNLERTDGGRHSLRLTRASSLTIAPQSALTYPGKRETTPKSHLKSTYSSTSKGNLSITGVSSGTRPQSQPGSRSNSPKHAEKLAWKRRKEYDPRRAVAEAKAKTTKEPGTVSSASSTSSISTRSKPSTRDNLKRRMIRSASFGNSVNLTAHALDSNSHGLGLPERKDRHNDEGFRRSFMPVHGSSSLRSDRSAHSADEDDTLSSITSTQGQGRNHVTSKNAKSAFTPPLIKTGHSTSPAPLTVKRRNSLHSNPGSLSLSVAPGLSNMDLDEACSTPNSLSSPQTSYDNLIVSSIYQLSLKLSTNTDKTLHRLREEDRVTFTPSPIDDFMSDTGKSDFPAWKSANQELAGVLKNLRKLERHVMMMNRVLFPEEDMDSDMLTGREKQKYFQEIERIRSELAGFHPIDNPRREDYEAASPEMEEFSDTF